MRTAVQALFASAIFLVPITSDAADLKKCGADSVTFQWLKDKSDAQQVQTDVQSVMDDLTNNSRHYKDDDFGGSDSKTAFKKDLQGVTDTYNQAVTQAAYRKSTECIPCLYYGRYTTAVTISTTCQKLIDKAGEVFPDPYGGKDGDHFNCDTIQLGPNQTGFQYSAADLDNTDPTWWVSVQAVQTLLTTALNSPHPDKGTIKEATDLLGKSLQKFNHSDDNGALAKSMLNVGKTIACDAPDSQK